MEPNVKRPYAFELISTKLPIVRDLIEIRTNRLVPDVA